MDEYPVTVTELLQLTQSGIPLEHITWPRVTMTSDQWICIRHGKHSGKPANRNIKNLSYVTILNPSRADFPQTWQTSAASVMMNPEKPIVAVKAGKEFQVFNLDNRELIVSNKMSEKAVYWRWINSSVIAIVTGTSAYHWDLTKTNSQPELIFKRHNRLKDAAIVHYVTDSSMSWIALVGLTIEDERICGVTQIYSLSHDLSQPIEAHAVTFCTYQMPGNQHPSTLLVAVVREAENKGKLHIIELGPPMQGNQASSRHLGDLLFEDDWEKYDFPVSVQVSVKLGLVFILTKYGQLLLCDLESAILLSTNRVCADIIFVAALSSDGQGVLAVSRNGQVLSISVKPSHIAYYVRNALQRPLIAERLEKVLSDMCQLSMLST
ncbi:Clathrin heavy chain 2 [Chamberlinius hualienensis]